ncbi:hypothetical protein PG987_009220 [Apiospora arundinis]
MSTVPTLYDTLGNGCWVKEVSLRKTEAVGDQYPPQARSPQNLFDPEEKAGQGPRADGPKLEKKQKRPAFALRDPHQPGAAELPPWLANT